MIEDIILRQEVYSPLSTKGSALDADEYDNNLINIYQDLAELEIAGEISAYGGMTVYDDTENKYATYDNKLWKWINAAASSGVTPTEGTDWTRVQISDLAHEINKDQYLDRYGVNEISAADLAVSANRGIYSLDIDDTSILDLDGFGNYVLTIPAAGAGYRIFALYSSVSPATTVVTINIVENLIEEVQTEFRCEDGLTATFVVPALPATFVDQIIGLAANVAVAGSSGEALILRKSTGEDYNRIYLSLQYT